MNNLIEGAVLSLFLDLIKAMGVVGAYMIGAYLVDKKSPEPDEWDHTYWDKAVVYLKAFIGCFLAAFLVSNIDHLRGFSSRTIESLGLFLIPCLFGIEYSYKKKKIHVKRRGQNAK